MALTDEDVAKLALVMQRQIQSPLQSQIDGLKENMAILQDTVVGIDNFLRNHLLFIEKQVDTNAGDIKGIKRNLNLS